MRSLRLALAAAVMAAIVVGAPAGAASRTQSDAAAKTTVSSAYALVQLTGAPLSTSVKTKPAPGKKVDFSSASVKSYKALLAAQRNEFKAWLQKAAPKAQVVKGYDLALNAVSVKLNGTSLSTIRTSPLVTRAELQGVYRMTSDPDPVDPDLEIISAIDGWEAAGASSATAGEGVKVGVIDSGIDVGHPCFDDADYADSQQLGDKRYTSNKVIVARVFNNKINQNGFDAKAVDSHGTHVAGTIACNYDTAASVEGARSRMGSRASRRAPCWATTTSSRATSRTRAVRTSSTRSRPPTPTAWIS